VLGPSDRGAVLFYNLANAVGTEAQLSQTLAIFTGRDKSILQTFPAADLADTKAVIARFDAPQQVPRNPGAVRGFQKTVR